MAGPGGDEPAAGDSYWAQRPTPPSPPQSPPASSFPYPPPPPPPLPPGAAESASTPWASATSAAPGVSVPRRSRRLVVVAVVVVVALVAAATAVALVGGTKSAQAAVIDSVNSTLADHTAHMTMTMSGGATGATFTGTGSGAVDFTQGAMQLQMNLNVDSQSVSLNALYVGQTVYIGFAQLGEIEPGKTWLSLDLSSLQSAAGGGPGALGSGNNPAAMLRIFAQQGSTVVPLGGSTVDGVAVQGYSVTFNPAAIKRELANDNLPAWLRQAVSQVNLSELKGDLYVDGSGMLLRFSIGLNASSGSSGPVAVDESLDFSDFGTPVDVTAPPADQVVSFQQFLQDAEAAAGQGGSS